MRLIIGIFFLIVAFIGTIFFKSYHGTVIVSPGLWYFLFLLIGFCGVGLVYSSSRKFKNIATKYTESKIKELKANAEKVTVDYDLCEFKNGGYAHEVPDERLSALRVLPTGGFTYNPTTTETVIQSYLIYAYTNSGKTEKYISQFFPFEQTSLKILVLNHKVSLYIDRFDKTKYFFDIKE